MKILKNNYNNESNEIIRKPIRALICENCKSELQYDEDDERVGALGLVFVDCPCCGYENMLIDNEKEVNLTMDNVEFPTHFFHTSTDNAIDLCNNKEVKNAIRDSIDFFRTYKEEFAWSTQCGNLYVAVFKFDGDEEYHIIVSNNYYETDIPFEKEDYKYL